MRIGWGILSLDISLPESQSLNTEVKDLIEEDIWIISSFLRENYLEIVVIINQVQLPYEQLLDQLIWEHSSNGVLMAKDTHKFLEGNHTLEWVTLIWKICIPPSTSFMMWRLIHNKISLDDNMHTKREASWLRWVVYTILKGKQHPTFFYYHFSS